METKEKQGQDKKLSVLEKQLLEQIAGIHELPVGAYNIRENGSTQSRHTTEHIDIVTKTDVQGIDVFIKAGTKNESLHIPVILSQSGLTETVYNDFHIGEDCDITIIAGCGIHNGGSEASQHDGIHRFYLGKNSRLRYLEKHYGQGDGNGERIMNPTTEAVLEENSYMEMDTVQIKGVDSTKRITKVIVKDNATLIIKEKIMTHGNQWAETGFEVELEGANSKTNVVSRSVAKNNSRQLFLSKINGNNLCSGHTECDAIIMDNASVSAIPEITANHIDASLIHEAAIGKIAGEQIIKLMTLGLTEAEAEQEIINGFMK